MPASGKVKLNGESEFTVYVPSGSAGTSQRTGCGKAGFAEPLPLPPHAKPAMTRFSCPPSTTTAQLAVTSEVVAMSTKGAPAVMAPASSLHTLWGANDFSEHRGPQLNAKSTTQAQRITDRASLRRREW